MIQITFQAAFDPFHTIFRFLRVIEITNGLDYITLDQARILDFYLLYPFRSAEIRLQAAHKKYKRVAADFNHLKPYGELPESFLLFSRMQGIQVAALDTLAFNDYIDRKPYEQTKIRPTNKLFAEEVLFRIYELNREQTKLVDFIKTLASEYTIYGPDGLKARTGLLEYRYDKI